MRAPRQPFDRSSVHVREKWCCNLFVWGSCLQCTERQCTLPFVSEPLGPSSQLTASTGHCFPTLESQNIPSWMRPIRILDPPGSIRDHPKFKPCVWEHLWGKFYWRWDLCSLPFVENRGSVVSWEWQVAPVGPDSPHGHHIQERGLSRDIFCYFCGTFSAVIRWDYSSILYIGFHSIQPCMYIEALRLGSEQNIWKHWHMRTAGPGEDGKINWPWSFLVLWAVDRFYPRALSWAVFQNQLYFSDIISL